MKKISNGSVPYKPMENRRSNALYFVQIDESQGKKDTLVNLFYGCREWFWWWWPRHYIRASCWWERVKRKKKYVFIVYVFLEMRGWGCENCFAKLMCLGPKRLMWRVNVIVIVFFSSAFSWYYRSKICSRPWRSS